MFLEPHFKGQRSGWIEVICGSMFSGKTEELIRRLKRSKIANQRVEIFKPGIDKRYGEEKVVSHDSNYILSTPIEHSSRLLQLSEGVDVVGVDEAQFFDEELPENCQRLALRGIRVIVAGLDMDYRGLPFGPMPNLLAVSEYITKVHAICPHCGNLATHSYRLVQEEATILLGEKDRYEPRCRTCYHMGNILDLRTRGSEG
ncbi:MAG: thymidine kinase [Saprospiraceae bacterium]|nr:thymidine kinase [Saprospiraceae bacterium]MDZ4705050.1 thymidine kinase [Saprospiraceae bacterium]